MKVETQSGRIIVCPDCDYVDLNKERKTDILKEIALYRVSVRNILILWMLMFVFVTFLSFLAALIWNFDNEKELDNWLSTNKVNERTYNIENNNCVDFTVDLIMDGIEDGYVILPEPCWENGLHMRCLVWVGGNLHHLEPQTDEHWRAV